MRLETNVNQKTFRKINEVNPDDDAPVAEMMHLADNSISMTENKNASVVPELLEKPNE